MRSGLIALSTHLRSDVFTLALNDALGVRFTGEKGGRMSALRRAQRNGEREGGLAYADVSTDHDEISPAEPAAQRAVEARESGRDGVGRGSAVGDRVYAPHDASQRREIGDPGHRELTSGRAVMARSSAVQ